KDAVLLVKKIKELKLDSVLIGGAGGFTHRKFIEGAAGSVEGLLTATLWTHELSYPGTGEYNDIYIRKHSVPPDYHGAEAYASLFVIGDVLERAESFSAENIKKALDETEISTPFGPVKFESYGKHQRQNSLPTMVLQIINNQFEVVWPQDIATSELQESWGARPRINP
ncbi:MAG: ABC transporter substrate-binding protein, partial [Gammaproteobacteria bacterium]|nr:ABC transporter substrate-binding protein [Gammaproteobacteria bacterium]